MAAPTMSTEAQSVASVTPSYRRNGKLFSCEPCRRGKLRCDHASPVCGRCSRRNKPDQCIYHPAPLTKPRSSLDGQLKTTLGVSRASSTAQQIGSPPRNGLVSPPSSKTPSLDRGDFSTLPTSSKASVSIPSVLQSPRNLTMGSTPTSGEDRRTSSSYASPSDGSNMSFRDSKAGFLGATSYSAVFAENPGSLSVIMEPHDAAEDTASMGQVPPEKIQQGAEILSMLRDISIYQQFTQRYFDACDGIVVSQTAYSIWVEELWSEFGRLLQDAHMDQLMSLSEMVWRNTRRPMKVHGQMTAREWARSASGRNLRWEVVGTIFSLVGLVAANLSCWDSIFESIRESFIDRETFTERMRKASGYCLCFCYESEVLNDIYVSFLYEDLVLLESIKGDAHYMSWQRTGELIDTIVALGLHQGNPVDQQTPFFLAEMRKKVFIASYGRDKQVATFLGRPPRLSHRYCKMELPLDLTTDELFLEGPELAAILANLDADGWNTTRNLHRTTWQRVWVQHCRIREDILEIALGTEDDNILFQAEQVRQKMEKLNNSFPDFMHIKPEDLLNENSIIPPSVYKFGRAEQSVRQVNAMFTICIHAGIAQTEFLLQRALVNRKQTDTRELIPISRRLLQIVLLGQSKRDYFRDWQGDLTYLMANNGLAAAGVLAIELLKQEQSRLYAPEILPRSETIQELSVFISSLASVSPGEGNYFVCNQGRRALKKVLDQILSPSNPNLLAGPVLGTGASEAGGMGVGDDMGLFFPTGNDVDFLSWLDNVEWDKAGVWGAPTASQEAAQQQQP